MAKNEREPVESGASSASSANGKDVAPKKSDPKKAPKKKDKNKKPNFFVRMGRKIKETFSELKRVSWPTFGKALKATGVVLGIVLIFLVLVTGVNYGFSKLLELMTNA